MFSSCVRLKIKQAAQQGNIIAAQLVALAGQQWPSQSLQTAYTAGVADMRIALFDSGPFSQQYGAALIADPRQDPITGWLVAAVNDCVLGKNPNQKRVRGTFHSKLGDIKRRIRV